MDRSELRTKPPKPRTSEHSPTHLTIQDTPANNPKSTSIPAAQIPHRET